MHPRHDPDPYDGPAPVDVPPGPVEPEPVHLAGDGPDRSSSSIRAALPFVWLLSLLLAFGGGLIVERTLIERPAGGGPVAVVPTPMPTPAPTSNATPIRPASPGATPAGSGAPTEPSPTDSPTPAPPTGPPATQPPDAPPDFGVFWEAFRVVQDRYVDRTALEPPNLTYGAVRGMVDALNDTGHSLFLTPEDLKAEQQSLQGVITGIGVVLDATGNLPTITTVISGGPAARAGIRPGDQLVKVDDTDVTGLQSSEIVKLVRGAEGTTVRITVIHKGQTDPVEVSIVRERITVPAVTSAMVPGTDILDIRVVQFSTEAAKQFHEQLQKGIDAGAKRIVLDVRNDPGGFVNEAVAISSEFLREGNVYLRQDAQGTQTPVGVVEGGLAFDLPVVVLVDKGTASSAEITAGALQDAKRGPVIGVTTFGTGTLLNVFELSDGSAVRLGIEQWLTPSGRQIWRKGVVPDEKVELPADGIPLEPDQLAGQTVQQLLAGTDTQFARALQLLGEQ